MSSITEQFSAATKSQLEAQFQIFNTLASTAVESAEKVITLNINATKASVEKSSAAAKQWLAAKDPKEFFTLSAQPPGHPTLIRLALPPAAAVLIAVEISSTKPAGS